jgi:hypothetical protein
MQWKQTPLAYRLAGKGIDKPNFVALQRSDRTTAVRQHQYHQRGTVYMYKIHNKHIIQ